MDVSDLLAITLKEKIENKGSQMGHTKKIFKKKIKKILQFNTLMLKKEDNNLTVKETFF
jgi:hypothetical protein